MARQRIVPNAENASFEAISTAMESAPNRRSFRRLGAIKALLLDTEAQVVAKIFNRSERMVRLWIELFNRGGMIAGLQAVSCVATVATS